MKKYGLIAFALIILSTIAIYIVDKRYVLYPITKIELKLFSILDNPKRVSKTCDPEVFIHKGYAAYSKEKTYETNRILIEQAISNGVKSIEIDISILKDTVLMRHDGLDLNENATLEDFRKLGEYEYLLEEFLAKKLNSFDKVIIDVKRIYTDVSHAKKTLKDIIKRFNNKKIILIGRKCDLLEHFKDDYLVGCEMYNLLGNYLSGFSVWSRPRNNLTRSDISLNSILGLKSLFWTYDDPNEVKNKCWQQPEMVIVEKL